MCLIIIWINSNTYVLDPKLKADIDKVKAEQRKTERAQPYPARGRGGGGGGGRGYRGGGRGRGGGWRPYAPRPNLVDVLQQLLQPQQQVLIIFTVTFLCILCSAICRIV